LGRHTPHALRCQPGPQPPSALALVRDMSERKIAADTADTNFVCIKLAPSPFLMVPIAPFFSRITSPIGSACDRKYRTGAEIEHLDGAISRRPAVFHPPRASRSRCVALCRFSVTFPKTKNGEARGVPLHVRVVAELANLKHREGEVFRRRTACLMNTWTMTTLMIRRLALVQAPPLRVRANERRSRTFIHTIAVILGQLGITPRIAISARCSGSAVGNRSAW
jgi:hypothetical protein